MQFDGYTDLFTAYAIVQCGLTYHIKLAICDGGDGILNSAVFLERESFASNLVVQVAIEFEAGGPEGNTLYEDCGSSTIVFSRPETGDVNTPLTAYIEYGGVAQELIDYTDLPDSVFFAPGVEFVEFPLTAILDFIAEGEESIILTIANFAECGETLLESEFEFFINDTAEPLVVDGYTTQICQGDEVEIVPIISGGYGVFSYDWSTGETDSTIFVSPDISTSYNLIVSDTCGMPSDDADFQINILDFPDLLVDIIDPVLEPILLNCGEWITITASAQGGDGNYEYNWYNQDGANLWGWMNTVSVSSWSNADFVYVDVTDGCGFVSTDSIEIQLNVPALVVDVPSTMSVLCNQPFDLEAIVSGGSAPYSYSWVDNGTWLWDWDNILNHTVGSPTTIMLTVSDQCGQIETFEIDITIDSPAIIIDLEDEMVGSCFTLFDIDPTVSAGSGGFSFQWLNNGSNLSTNEDITFQSDFNTILTLNVEDACGATASDQLIITIENPPLIINIGEDIYASCIDENDLDVEITSGSGGYSYQWLVNNTEVSTNSIYTIQSFETVDVQLVVEDACGGIDSDTLTVFIPDIPLAISVSADTSICPNGSATMWALAQGGEEGFTYEWPQLGIQGDVVTLNGPESSSAYTVTATDICGESISSNITVQVLPISAQFLVTEVAENTFQFTAAPEPACEEGECFYMWDFGDGDISYEENPLHEFDGLGSYTTSFTVVNDIGCNDMQLYTITGPPAIWIPNSFTPNGDGINDVFQVVAHDLLEFDIVIFNRWGEVVFKSTNPDESWTGGHKDGEYFIPNGIYNYVARIKGNNTDAKEYTGSITLMR
jgi:gliding motility-associated-like protein